MSIHAIQPGRGPDDEDKALIVEIVTQRSAHTGRAVSQWFFEVDGIGEIGYGWRNDSFKRHYSNRRN